MAMSAHSEPQTMTYTVGNNTYILQVPEAVPMYCRSTAGEFVHVGNTTHAKLRLTQTCVPGDLLYIMFESGDILTGWVGYNYTESTQSAIDTKRDAEVDALKARVAQLEAHVAKFAHFMRLVTIGSNMGDTMIRSTPAPFQIMYNISDGMMTDTCFYVSINIHSMHINSNVNNIRLEFPSDVMKIKTLRIGNMGLPDSLVRAMNNSTRCEWAAKFLHILESIGNFPDLETLQIGEPYSEAVTGKFERLESPFPAVRSSSIGTIDENTHRCTVGYKYFEAIGRTNIKTLRLGTLCGLAFEVSSVDARVIRRLMREKNMSVVISGLHAD